MKAEDMIWMGKRQFTQKARNNQGCDVSIRKSMCNGKTKARMTIRNGVSGVISETEYLQFSVPDVKHIYFMSGDKDTGLKMSSQDSLVSDNRYVQINKEEDAEEIVPFVGDYDLLFDQECSLYYIQK